MHRLREWLLRVWGALRQGRGNRDIEDELRAHLELAADDERRRGLSHHEAERAARLRAGALSQSAEALRDQRGLPWADDLARDLRYALRTLRRSPGFTVTVLLTLALGIGANTAIFQILDAVRLRPLPVDNPQQLTILELADTEGWTGRRTTSYPALTNRLWEAFRERQTVFSGVLAWSNAGFQYGSGSETETSVVRGLFVSGQFFHVLGVQPFLGRVFTEADDQVGCGAPVAVVSHSFWQRYLGGAPWAVGRTISINSRVVEVVGVTPARFTGVEVGRSYDIAVPICSHETLGSEAGWLDDGTTWWLTVMGRLEPDRALESANAELQAISPGLFETTLPANYSADDARAYTTLTLRAVAGGTGVSALRRRYSDPLAILLATTALVLLMACTNLANLIMARWSAREREFSVRLAIGATRGRLVRQGMVENGLLAVGGAVAGVALGATVSRSLVTVLGDGFSLALPLDGRVIAFAVTLALLTCLAFGLIPVWRASRGAVQHSLKGSAGTHSDSRKGLTLKQTLVVSQVALSVILVFGAFLFVGTLRNLLAVDFGFDPEHVFVARIDLARVPLPDEGRRLLERTLLHQIRSAASVAAAAEVRHVPMGGTGSSLEVWRNGADRSSRTAIRLNAISDDYLRTLGIRLIAGRDFSVRDSEEAPLVAIVNHAFGRRLGLERNPVGQRFRTEGLPGGSDRLYEIVGLVPDTKFFTVREEPLPIAFVPIAQVDDPRRVMDVVARAAAASGNLAADIRRVVTGVHPGLSVDVRPLDSGIREGLRRERFMAMLSSFFGGLAAVIAAIGVYGVMSYAVVRRTHEIGIRLALGARRADILATILRQTGTLVALGLGTGAGLAMALSGSARSLVFGLQPQDPRALGLACLLLAVVAAGAAFVPARRAASLDPLVALRRE